MGLTTPQAQSKGGNHMDFNGIDLEKYYEMLLVQRRCGLRNVLQRIENIRDVIENYPTDTCKKDSPFDSIKKRMKTFESACDKVARKGWPLNEESLDKVHDIAGIRIITPYESDVYEIRDTLYNLIENTKPKNTMRIAEERDYIKTPKPSGYRSLHLLVEVKISAQKGVKPRWTPVEIQIRTKSMDLWASYEHTLKYKNPNPSPETVQMFSELAGNLAYLEKKLMKLRENTVMDIIAAKEAEAESDVKTQ